MRAHNSHIQTRRSRHRRIPVLMGAVFLPTDLTGLQLWLDANDASTLFQDAAKTTAAGDGDVVGAWADKSGQGKDATQTTTADKPTLQTGIVNGLPVVRFDGTDDFLNIPDLSALTEGELFVVIKLDADPPVLNSGAWKFGSTGQNTFWPTAATGVIQDSFGSTVRKTVGNLVTSLAQFNIYNVVSRAGEWTANLNGAQEFTTGTNTAGFTNVPRIGRNGAADFLKGDKAELLLYSPTLSIANRGLIADYLATKYGVTLV